MSVSSDHGKQYVLTGKNGQINAFSMPDFQYTTTGKLIIYRLINDRDMKILITSKGKTTGTGKTTLAIALARFVNRVRNSLFKGREFTDNDGKEYTFEPQEWSAKEYAFMDIWDYLKKYKTALPGDCYITDELEYLADRRDFMTNENKKFSQAWSILRYKNVVTIGTAPGLSDLEKRVPETADLWINVVHPGRANVYYLTFDDFEWSRIYKRLRKGGYKEAIHWKDLGSINDPDYEFLKQKKREMGVPGIDDQSGKEINQKTLNKQEKNLRNYFAKETLKKVYNKEVDTYFTQKEIGEMAGVSQQQVSKLKSELIDDGEIEG